LRRTVRAFTLSGLIGVVMVGCSSSGSHDVAPTSTPTPTTGTSVVSRAPGPTQTDAPGIQFTKGSLSVTLYNHTFEISAQDWNTITDTSVVPRDIGVSLDSDFHATQTTRNRFQYLADRMIPFITQRFGAIGIASAVKGTTDVAVVALINPTDNGYQLTGFNETITESPPTTTVASANFYTTPATALTIPAHNIYFVRLSASVAAAPPPNETTTSYHFSWDKLYNCGQAACP
jgi:hypothetical protein